MKLRLKTLSKTKVGIVKLYKVAAWFVLQFSKSTLLVRSESQLFRSLLVPVRKESGAALKQHAMGLV